LQLGSGSLLDASVWSTPAINWFNINPVQILEDVAIFHTEGSSAFAIQTNGNLWAWGDNSHGQLGDGTRISRSTPVFIMDGVESIITGDLTSFAKRVDGRLWVWGYNAAGQFGDGTYISRLRPMRTNFTPHMLRMEAGSVFVIAEHDSLWTWGVGYESLPTHKLNNVAEIYIDTNGDLYVLQTNGVLWVFEGSTGEQILIMNDVQAFSIYWGVYLVITISGDVWGWGGNWSGILGDHESWITQDEPVLVFGG